MCRVPIEILECLPEYVPLHDCLVEYPSVSPPSDDTDDSLSFLLSNEMRTDLRRVAETVSRLNYTLEQWGPAISANTSAIVDIQNRETALERRIDLLTAQLAEKQAWEEKQEGRDKEGRKERQEILRWTVGMAVGMAGLAIAALTFAFSHLVIK